MIVDYTDIIETAKNFIKTELEAKKYQGRWAIQFGFDSMITKVPPRYLEELYWYAAKLGCTVTCLIKEQSYTLNSKGIWIE